MTFQELHERHYHALETDRLLLRPLSPDDAEAMFSYTSQPESFRFLRRAPHQSIEEDRQFLQKAAEAYQTHSDFIWGICEKGSGRLIGTCRLFDLHLTDRRAEVSYLIHPAYQGRGIASDTVRALIRYAFGELGLVRLQARCVSENIGSERVMQKCGMALEGTLRSYANIHNSWKDFKLYAIIKETDR